MSEKRIEDHITDVLKGESQKNALDFIGYLGANEITLEGSENYWECKYKDESVCFLWVDGSDNAPGPWTIWSDQVPGTWATWSDGGHDLKYANFPIDENIKKIAWANVNVCASCGGECSPGKRKTVLGKEFENLCNSTMAFTNPDANTLDCTKKMVEIRRNDILNKV